MILRGAWLININITIEKEQKNRNENKPGDKKKD